MKNNKKRKFKSPEQLKAEGVMRKINTPYKKIEDIGEEKVRNLLSATHLLVTIARSTLDDFKDILSDNKVSVASNGFANATNGLEAVNKELFAHLTSRFCNETKENFDADFFHFEDLVIEFVNGDMKKRVEQKALMLAEILSTHGIEGGKQEVIIEKFLKVRV